MSEKPIYILPYSQLVGQEQLKLALELAYIVPALGGVLISGQRGTGKSTAVRAFAQMMYNDLPVTLPINATEDRVVGGWYIDKLMDTQLMQSPDGWMQAQQPGLLETANGKILFIDEINLLDDHIVNIILDVTATGVLVIQREERSNEKRVSFTLVGTMNPEEGGLRPQLLDRFGLLVPITAETDEKRRVTILKAVLDFDRALRRIESGWSTEYFEQAKTEDSKYRTKLEAARDAVENMTIPTKIAQLCVRIAQAFSVEGHRADYVMALASQACAALEGKKVVAREHLQKVAPLSLMHRLPDAMHRRGELWTEKESKLLAELLRNG